MFHEQHYESSNQWISFKSRLNNNLMNHCFESSHFGSTNITLDVYINIFLIEFN